MVPAKVFEFSPERFNNPYVILSVAILVIGMFLLFFLEKLIFYILIKKEKKHLDSDNVKHTEAELIEKENSISYKAKLIGKLFGFFVIVLGCIILFASGV